MIVPGTQVKKRLKQRMLINEIVVFSTLIKVLKIGNKKSTENVSSAIFC